MLRLSLFLLLCLLSRWAIASTLLTLPSSACPAPGRVFAGDFEPAGGQSSGGAGGAFGYLSRTVDVPGLGTRTYYRYVPTDAVLPMPVVLLLHGAAGSASAARDAARQARDDWAPIAAAHGFAVVAPVASGSSGGWLLPTDYAVMRAALDDLFAGQPIDTTRVFGWGFSAGGHVMHALALDAGRSDIGFDTFAGYAVNAGVLAAATCSSAASCDALLAGLPGPTAVMVTVGLADPLLPYARSDHARFQARDWSPLRYREVSGGHTYTSDDLEQAWGFLCRYRRQ